MVERDLFNRIAEHRKIFFRWSWVDYSTLRPGSLRPVPPDDQLSFWKRDYEAMRREMFFGDVPNFSEILHVVSEFEQQFNQVTSST